MTISSGPGEGKRFDPRSAPWGIATILVCLPTTSCAASAETPPVVKYPNGSFLDVAAQGTVLLSAQNPMIREALTNLKAWGGTGEANAGAIQT